MWHFPFTPNYMQAFPNAHNSKHVRIYMLNFVYMYSGVQ